MIGAEGLDAVKIGTTTDIGKRLGSLQTGLPLTLSVLWTCEGNRDLERALHEEFRAYRQRGEWFDLTRLGDPVAVVYKSVIKHAPRLGLPTPPARSRQADAPPVVVPLLNDAVVAERTMSARPATMREIELMGYPYGTIMLVTVLTAVQRDADGNPLAVSETALVGSHALPEGFLPSDFWRHEDE
ncbi:MULTISPECIES: GIY-YIG nuclease family protein [Streptomyces]|uniref:GIY-YIG nuclease family protein n=2 Tax=Streptomyces TaxID=1883 RepID=A0ABU4KE80_9ACTN|nr:GIY-YIG nuclease family protein [Streptomyces roseolus]MDX2295864.1 GIY-YIG nuclease family protein [Streptomyces roseolus]